MVLLQSIIWDPSGVILTIGSYELRWYSLLFAAGFVVSYIILKTRFKKANIPVEKLDSLTLYVFLGTVIGARLGHCLFYDFASYVDRPLEIFLPISIGENGWEFIGYRGLASHGGAVGIVCALLLYVRKQKINLWWLLDQMGLVVPFAGACIRFGNLMNSEIIGNETDVPWAFVFKQVDNVARHPGQLYEALAYLVTFGILWYFKDRFKEVRGKLFGLFLVLMFGVRFLLEFLKINQESFDNPWPINMGQILSIPFIIAGIWILMGGSIKAKKEYLSRF